MLNQSFANKVEFERWGRRRLELVALSSAWDCPSPIPRVLKQDLRPLPANLRSRFCVQRPLGLHKFTCLRFFFRTLVSFPYCNQKTVISLLIYLQILPLKHPTTTHNECHVYTHTIWCANFSELLDKSYDIPTTQRGFNWCSATRRELDRHTIT